MDFSLNEEQTAIGELAAQVLGDRSTNELLRELEKLRWTTLRPHPVGLARRDRRARGVRARGARRGRARPGRAGHRARSTSDAPQRRCRCGRRSVWAHPPIAEFAPEALAAEILGGVAAGTTVLTAAWHEDGGEALVPTTVASRVGDGYQLTGIKVCVPAGAVADAILVPAAIENGSVGLFLVRTVGEGVGVEPLLTTLGDPQAAILLGRGARRARGRGPRVAALGLRPSPSRPSARSPSASAPKRCD